MAQHVGRQLDDVRRHDVVAAAGQGQGAGAEDQVDRGARAGAEGHVARDVAAGRSRPGRRVAPTRRTAYSMSSGST